MEKTFIIKLKINIPEELAGDYLSDEQVIKNIKEMLFDELADSILKPEITVTQQD